jgi:hypothetical protein
MDHEAELQHKRQTKKKSNSQPTKIVRHKSEKTSSTKKGIKRKKNVDLKRIRIKFDIKRKSNQIKS